MRRSLLAGFAGAWLALILVLGVAAKPSLPPIIIDIPDDATAQNDDFGTSGLLTDVVVESTLDAGVLVEGVGFENEDIDFSVSTIATGDSQILLKDNLVQALSVSQASNLFLTFVTTDAAERSFAWAPFYIADPTAGVSGRERVGGTAFTSTAQSTAILGTNETQTPQYFSNGSYTIPANRLKAGTRIEFDAWGIHDVAGASGSPAGSLIVGFACGTTQLMPSQAVDPADNDRFHAWGALKVLSVGAPGSVTGNGQIHTTGIPTNAQITQIGVGSSTTMTANLDTTVNEQCGIYMINAVGRTDSESEILTDFTLKLFDAPT